MLTPDKQALKRETRALVRAAGGVEAAEGFVRTRRSVIADYYSPHKADCFMPVDVVVDLEAVTRGTADWPLVTRHLAAQANCALVALPAAEDDGDDWFAVIARLTTELGDVTGGICDAAGDGHVCAADVRRLDLIKHCDDIIAVAVNLRARFDAIETGGHQGT